MNEKGSPLNEEEKDFFVDFLSKRKRNIEKKLKEILDLEARNKEELNELQLKKVEGKGETLEKKKFFNDVLELYKSAKRNSSNQSKESPQQKTSSKEQTTQGAKDQGATGIQKDQSDEKVGEILKLNRVAEFLKTKRNQENISKILKESQIQSIVGLSQSLLRTPSGNEKNREKLETKAKMEVQKYLSSSMEASEWGGSYDAIRKAVERVSESELFVETDLKGETHGEAGIKGEPHEEAGLKGDAQATVNREELDQKGKEETRAGAAMNEDEPSQEAITVEKAETLENIEKQTLLIGTSSIGTQLQQEGRNEHEGRSHFKRKHEGQFPRKQERASDFNKRTRKARESEKGFQYKGSQRMNDGPVYKKNKELIVYEKKNN